MNFTFVHNNLNVLNEAMGLYFIEDPGGYRREIMPVRNDHEPHQP